MTQAVDSSPLNTSYADCSIVDPFIKEQAERIKTIQREGLEAIRFSSKPVSHIFTSCINWTTDCDRIQALMASPDPQQPRALKFYHLGIQHFYNRFLVTERSVHLPEGHILKELVRSTKKLFLESFSKIHGSPSEPDVDLFIVNINKQLCRFSLDCDRMSDFNEMSHRINQIIELYILSDPQGINVKNLARETWLQGLRKIISINRDMSSSIRQMYGLLQEIARYNAERSEAKQLPTVLFKNYEVYLIEHRPTLIFARAVLLSHGANKASIAPSWDLLNRLDKEVYAQLIKIEPELADGK